MTTRDKRAAAAAHQERIRKVARHEAAHAVLAETAGSSVAVIELELDAGDVGGFARLEPGQYWPPYATFAGQAEGAAPESRRDRDDSYADAAAWTMPGHSVWAAMRGPNFERQLLTWRADAARKLDRFAPAVDALASELVRRGKLDGETVRAIMRRAGAPTSK